MNCGINPNNFMNNMNMMNGNFGMMPQMNNMNYMNNMNMGIPNMNMFDNNFNNDIKKGNNEEINYNFQNREIIGVCFKKTSGERTSVLINPHERIKDLNQKYRNKTYTSDEAKYLFNAMKLDTNDEKTITKVGLRNGSTILVNDVKDFQYEGCGGGNIGLLKSKKPCTKIYNGELKGLSKLCYLKEISSKLKLEQLDKLPEKINLIIRILKNS